MRASMVVLIACAALGLSMAGAREACKCSFFKEMTRWMNVRTFVSLCSRGRGRLVRSTLLCGEKGWKRGRRWRGGGLVEGGGGFRHVPGCERPFGGRGLRLRLAHGSAFQQWGPDWLRGLAGVLRALSCAAGEGGRGRFGGLFATLSGRGGGALGGGGCAVGRCVTCCKATRGASMGLGRSGG